MIGAADRRAHSPAALARRVRKTTTLIVLHRTINVDADRDGDRDFEDVVRFFTKDPEGIATVSIGKPYAQLRPIIESWRRFGIPAAYQGRGFVPYHVLVDARGRAANTLDLHVVGAHAGRWANDRSVAVAVVADPRKEEPTTEMVTAAVDVLAQLLARFPGVDVVDHDWVNRKQGYAEKGCIGARFPLQEVRAAAFAKAGIARP